MTAEDVPRVARQDAEVLNSEQAKNGKKGLIAALLGVSTAFEERMHKTGKHVNRS